MKLTRTLIAAALITTGSAAFAQAIINQASATAGNVTPGDAAGFPITISQPGSYKLTTNLFVPAGTAGIEITAPNVTLDLNGFTISSTNTCYQEANQSVTCSGPNLAKHGITTGKGSVIRNGVIQGFAGVGVNLAGGRELLEGLTITENRYSGINGSSGFKNVRVIDCDIELNGAHGAWLYGGLVSGSRVVSNGGNGITGDTNTMVTNSLVLRNWVTGLKDLTASNTISAQNQPNRSGVTGLGAGTNRDGNTTY
jgi:hypothetical protein